jgi:hypothetical protein
MEPKFARDFIPPGKKAIVIFTRGRMLRLHLDGTGDTGNWKLNPRRKVDLVIIYNQMPTEDGAEIFVARHTSTLPSDEDRRFAVHFANARAHGRTDLRWRDFADTTQNPIRYLEAG